MGAIDMRQVPPTTQKHFLRLAIVPVIGCKLLGRLDRRTARRTPGRQLGTRAACSNLLFAEFEAGVRLACGYRSGLLRTSALRPTHLLADKRAGARVLGYRGSPSRDGPGHCTIREFSRKLYDTSKAERRRIPDLADKLARKAEPRKVPTPVPSKRRHPTQLDRSPSSDASDSPNSASRTLRPSHRLYYTEPCCPARMIPVRHTGVEGGGNPEPSGRER